MLVHCTDWAKRANHIIYWTLVGRLLETQEVDSNSESAGYNDQGPKQEGTALNSKGQTEKGYDQNL